MKSAKGLADYILKTVCPPRTIYTAFCKVDRKYFVKEEYKNECYRDVPFSIGYNQTISQPSVVAYMLKLLNVKKGDKVLEIGAGSGFQTALLAYLVGDRGHVYALEIIEELVHFAKKNTSHYPRLNKRCTILLRDASNGLKKRAPFNRIIAAAEVDKNIPSSWFEQLASPGILVTPINNHIARYSKNKAGNIKVQAFPGFRFVPLISAVNQMNYKRGAK